MTIELSCCEGVMSCSGAEEPSSSISEPSHCRERVCTYTHAVMVRHCHNVLSLVDVI